MNESNLSQVNSYCKVIESDSVIEKTAKITTCLILIAFGIFGNVFVIVLALKYTARKRLHFLIINMAVADVLLMLSHVESYVTNSFIKYNFWNHMDETIGQILCKTLTFLYFVLVTEPIVSLLVISIERYRITRSVQISRTFSIKRRVVIIACCWLIPIAMNIEMVIFRQIIEQKNSEKYCGKKSTDESKTVSQITRPIYFTLILVFYSLMVLLSVLTLRSLTKQNAIEDSLSEVQRKQRRQRIRNAVKMVLYSLLLYSCCYLPMFTLATSLYFMSTISNICIDWSTLFFFAWEFLPLINSCLSPFIYCVCLSDFREAAR